MSVESGSGTGRWAAAPRAVIPPDWPIIGQATERLTVSGNSALSALLLSELWSSCQRTWLIHGTAMPMWLLAFAPQPGCSEHHCQRLGSPPDAGPVPHLTVQMMCCSAVVGDLHLLVVRLLVAVALTLQDTHTHKKDDDTQGQQPVSTIFMI